MTSVKNKQEQDKRDARVLQLYEKLLEVEQRLIPTGLHVFGQAPGSGGLQALLEVVVSFDRFDPDPHAASADSGPAVRALTGLIARGLGFQSYQSLVENSGVSESSATDRQRVESLLGRAIELFLSSPGDQGATAASAFLFEQAGVPLNESLSTFNLLDRIRGQLSENSELDALAAALRGEYIVPAVKKG